MALSFLAANAKRETRSVMELFLLAKDMLANSTGEMQLIFRICVFQALNLE